jgi:uncharacterized protein with HEPN domain
MTRKVKKYLFDIQSCIGELELLVADVETFENLENMPIQKRAFERLFEIIGEATRCLVAEQNDISISNTDKIIGMRNIIAHGYDVVNYRLLWQAWSEYIPVLRGEVEVLLNL